MTHPSNDNGHPKPLEVLVVDDEPAIAAAFAHALEMAGYRVTMATNMAQALKAPRPTVLVSDLYLGDQTGLDLLETLQRRGDHPRTVFVSGMPTLEDCRRAMRLGAVEMLPKPFSMDELLRAVGAACRNVDEAPTVADGQARLWKRIYAATPDSVERAARDLSAWTLRSCVPPAARTRIASALAEIVDNACRHAYDTQAAGQGRIEVHALLSPRELLLTVRDRGIGFHAGHQRPADAVTASSTNVGESDVSQSGLARAAALSEHLRIESRPDQGTTVHMTFGIQRVLFEDEDIVDLTDLDFLTPALARRVLRAVDEDSAGSFHLSPAIAVTVGRYLAAMRSGPSNTGHTN
jgi:DNA-binding response OmpR family regulator